MGFFDGTNDAKPRGQSDKLRPGRYPKLKVTACKAVQGFNGKYYVTELEVLDEPTATEDEHKPHPKGSTPSWTIRLDDQYGIGPAEAKAFAMAVMGSSDDSVDVEGLLEESLRGGFNGRTFGASVMSKVAKTSGREYLVARFYPAEDLPPPAPPAPTTEADEGPPGGPWYALPPGDKRGTHYNAQNEIITIQ